MKRPEPDSPDASRRAHAASAWLVKRDRGLTSAEQDEFLQWLAADPLHGEWFALHRHMVRDFGGLAEWRPEHSEEPNPDLLARSPRRRRWILAGTLAAASFTVALLWWQPGAGASRGEKELASNYERRILEDGSAVELNRGAIVSVAFTAAERRVSLVQGEALFTVAKNPARPFIVRAGGVDVRAVGTAFNVRLGTSAVEVLVTEGRVQVRPSFPVTVAGAPPSSAEAPSVAAGQRATFSRTAETAPVIVAVTPEDSARLLAWQPQLLDFSSVPLERAIAEFNRRNRAQFVLADPALGSLRIVASIRSDNVEGFVQFLVGTPGVEVQRRGENEIVIRRKP